MNKFTMKWLMCCLALLLVSSAALAVQGASASGDQLAPGFLSNANMALGGKSPANWYLGSWHQGKISLIRDTKVHKSSPASLCIDTHGAKAAGFVFQNLARNPTVPINIGCYIKVAGKFPAKSIQFAIQIFNEKWQQIGWIPLAFPAASTDWQHLGATATLPKSTVHALVGVSFSGNGKIWFDAVSVHPVKPEPGLESPLSQPPAPNLPVVVAPYDPHIVYIGRFDKSNPQGPLCQWSASAALIRFHGTAINVEINDPGQDRFQVIVDGKPTEVIVPLAGRLLYNAANKLPLADHTVEIFKRTEAFFGTAQFLGFRLNKGATLLAPPKFKRCIEVIGDSISCGYGVLAANQFEHFSPVTEDEYDAYGAVTARAFGAALVCIAWSGKTMAFKNTIPAIYGRTLPTRKLSRWNFSSWIPQVVIIALGTNDFARGVPPEKPWTAAYTAFVARLRKHYPAAQILLATSPMISDQWAKKTTPEAHLLKYLRAVVAARKAAGDDKVHVLIFAPQNLSNGVGADWHPSIKTQRIMAHVAIKAITHLLGWKPIASSAGSK
ncbi:MAG: SGNH/GDSL hydrolase family protein [Phycisphaerae bacterium]